MSTKIEIRENKVTQKISFTVLWSVLATVQYSDLKLKLWLE